MLNNLLKGKPVDLTPEKREKVFEGMGGGSGGSGGSGGFALITIDVDEEENLVPSHNYAEISDMIANGVIPYVVHVGMLFVLAQAPVLYDVSTYGASPEIVFTSSVLAGTSNSFFCKITIGENYAYFTPYSVSGLTATTW